MTAAIMDHRCPTCGHVPTLAQLEEKAYREAVEKHKDFKAICKALGIGRATLYRKLKEYGLTCNFSN